MESPLDPHSVRVLGSLVEKEGATPDSYPLTVNALIAACNQTSNRDPVMQLDESTVAVALDELLRRGPGELPVERDHHQLLHPATGERIPLHLERHQELRGLVGAKHLEGVGLEGQHGVETLDHVAMTEMDTVEGPDRDLARSIVEISQLDRSEWLGHVANYP